MAYGHARYALVIGAVGVLVSGCAADVRVGPERRSGDASAPDAGHGGGGAPGAAASGTTTAAEEAACAKYQRARCDANERCGPTATCDSFDCTDELFAEGTTRTPESVTACAQVFMTSSCDTLVTAPPCVTPGKRAAGEPCMANGQCASQRCSVTHPDEECGRCMGLSPKDGPCGASALCPGGQYCDGTRCADGPAMQYLPVGAACNPSTQVCDEGTCEVPDGGTGKCVAYPVVGQSCTTFCASPAVCSLEHRCEQPAAFGQPCVLTQGGTGIVGACAPGARCLDRTCVALGEPGDRCEPKDDGVQCHLGECRCIDRTCTDYACAERRYPGESCADANTFCDAPSQCIGGLCTSGKLGKAHADPCVDGKTPGP